MISGCTKLNCSCSQLVPFPFPSRPAGTACVPTLTNTSHKGRAGWGMLKMSARIEELLHFFLKSLRSPDTVTPDHSPVKISFTVPV